MKSPPNVSAMPESRPKNVGKRWMPSAPIIEPSAVQPSGPLKSFGTPCQIKAMPIKMRKTSRPMSFFDAMMLLMYCNDFMIIAPYFYHNI